MPAKVHLIAGPARCGKTKRLLATYRRQLAGRRLATATATSATRSAAGECFWIAPNQTAVAQLQESLLETAATALLRPNLATFAHFAEKLINRSQRRLQPISRVQKRRLLEHAIETTSGQGQLEHFARVASTPGFVNQVDDFIAAQKRQDIWPEAFDQRPAIDRSIRELGRIYAAYQQILHRRELYDAEGRFWAAREILTALAAKGPALAAAAATGNEIESDAESLPFDLIVVNGFNDFTASQYDILRLLGECSAQLLISLTVEQTGGEPLRAANRHGEPGSLLFSKTSDTLSRLQASLPQLTIEYLAASAPGPDSLQRLQQAIFRAPALRSRPSSGSSQSPLDNVQIVAAHSAVGEIEAIAGQIKQLLLSRQSQPEQIVVVCQGGEPMAELIAAVFPDYGIPFWSEVRPRLESEPLLRALSALLRLHEEDWPFQTLLEVINNRLFPQFDTAENVTRGGAAAGDSVAGDCVTANSVTADSVTADSVTANSVTADSVTAECATSFRTQPRIAIESCIRSAQLPSGRQALLEQLEYRHKLATQGTADERGVQVSITRSALRRLAERLAALPRQATIEQWVGALATLLTDLGALPLPSANRSRTASAWHLLRRGLASIAQVDAWSLAAQPALTLPELQSLIATLASQQRMPAQHEAVGRVRVLTAESARKLTVKHLLLAGLTEQAFASATPVAAAAIEPNDASDSASLLANMPEVAIQPATAARADDSGEPAESDPQLGDGMLLFYELVTRATQSLTLSYPALDSKGQSLPASPLLTELERTVGEHGIARRTIALGDSVSRERAPLSRGNFRRQAVDEALGGNQQWLAGMLAQPAFARTGSAILSGIESVAQRGERDAFGPYEGLLLSQRAQAALAQRFDARHLWSPSQLESYATCPFRFFSEHLLRLEPLSELALSNDARRRGSLLHQVLATVHQQLSEVVAEPGQDLAAVELVARFRAALDAAVAATPLRGIEQSLREIERREIEAWAPSYATQETSYRQQWKHLDQPPTPACFEVRFGPATRASAGDRSDPAATPLPFELDLGDERICLTGQIDRIDIGRVGQVAVFNIIDYKSGKEVKLKLDKIRAGYQLQLPLYAMAAEQLLLADQQAVALATGYWNIQGKGFDTAKGGSLQLRELAEQRLKTSDAWRQLQPAILRQVQKLIGGIRGGQFPVFNEDEQCTRSCSLSTVCRVAQVRSLEKIWTAPAGTTANEPLTTAEDDDGR